MPIFSPLLITAISLCSVTGADDIWRPDLTSRAFPYWLGGLLAASLMPDILGNLWWLSLCVP